MSEFYLFQIILSYAIFNWRSLKIISPKMTMDLGSDKTNDEEYSELILAF